MLEKSTQRPRRGRTRLQIELDSAERNTALRRPSSTRSAPASQSSATRAATSLRRAGEAEALERRRLPWIEVGSCRATTSNTAAPFASAWRSRPLAVRVHDRDTAHHETHDRIVDPGLEPRAGGRGSRFLRSSARRRPCRPSAPLACPHVPIRSGTSLAHARYASSVPGASVKPLAVDSRRVPGEQRATISTASRSADKGRCSSNPSRSSHAPFARPRYARPRETASSIAV